MSFNLPPSIKGTIISNYINNEIYYKLKTKEARQMALYDAFLHWREDLYRKYGGQKNYHYQYYRRDYVQQRYKEYAETVKKNPRAMFLRKKNFKKRHEEYKRFRLECEEKNVLYISYTDWCNRENRVRFYRGDRKWIEQLHIRRKRLSHEYKIRKKLMQGKR